LYFANIYKCPTIGSFGGEGGSKEKYFRKVQKRE